MPENIEAWWARRQHSKEAAVPYPVGTYRAEWAKYPILVRQYHPDLNREITLTQIPPAADVYLTWQCDTGHLFVATPEEQRSRPGRVRRRSTWCPVCTELAAPRRIRPAALWPADAVPRPPDAAPAPPPFAPPAAAPPLQAPPAPPLLLGRLAPHRPDEPAPLPLDSSAPHPPAPPTRTAPLPPVEPAPTTPVEPAPPPTDAPPRQAPIASPPLGIPAPRPPIRPARPARAGGGRRASVPQATPPRPAGTAFHSGHAPPTASAAEALLRQKLAARLEFDPEPNAIAVARPFHGRFEVWPDIVLAELRVALEYDTVGRFGLEHVGPREDSDRSKDRLLRAAGWEVVRLRCAPLPLLGPHDLASPAKATDRLIARLLDTLRTLRGDLIVNAYLRP